ncbi:MAG: hypothetical protein FJW38_03115 [Acidobacteria bacterium]|nr:hypothetical protein [Acidobacteriota bacterium]
MGVQKTMDFILEQQAASTARMAHVDLVMGRLVESHYNLEQHFAKLAEAITETNQAITETNKSLTETNRSVSAIALASA